MDAEIMVQFVHHEHQRFMLLHIKDRHFCIGIYPGVLKTLYRIYPTTIRRYQRTIHTSSQLHLWITKKCTKSCLTLQQR